MTFIYHTDIF